MVKPEQCRMPLKHCEDCEEWEPIPFHARGGICLARDRVLMRRMSASDSLVPSAEVAQRV